MTRTNQNGGTEPPKMCASCGKSDCGLRLCTACCSVWYCDVTCQRTHRKAHKRECKERAAELDRQVDAEVNEAKSARFPKDAEDGRTCWICLDGEEIDGGAPVRDCSCRGDAGFAHASCIIDYAKSKSAQTVASLTSRLEGGARIGEPVETLMQYRDLWCRCPNCQQFYNGPLSLSIANAFVDMTSTYHETDFRWIVSQINLGGVLLRISHDTEAAREVFTRVRPIVMSLRARAHGQFATIAPQLWPFFAIEVTSMLANVEESCKRYREAQEVVESYLDVISPNDVCYDMMLAKAKNFQMLAEGQNDTAFAVEVARKELQLCLDSCEDGEGERRLLALQCRRDLVKALFADHQIEEAIRLGRDLVERSERVLGTAHETTEAYREMLKNMEIVIAKNNQIAEALGGKRVAASAKLVGTDQLNLKGLSGHLCVLVKMTKDGKYIALVDPSTPGPLLKYKVLPSNVLFEPGTRILCRGLKSLSDGTAGIVQSYNVEKLRYVVAISAAGDDKSKVAMIKPENVVVDFYPSLS